MESHSPTSCLPQPLHSGASCASSSHCSESRSSGLMTPLPLGPSLPLVFPLAAGAVGGSGDPRAARSLKRHHSSCTIPRSSPDNEDKEVEAAVAVLEPVQQGSPGAFPACLSGIAVAQLQLSWAQPRMATSCPSALLPPLPSYSLAAKEGPS